MAKMSVPPIQTRLAPTCDLTLNQFEQLFSQNIDPSILDLLSQSAGDGDLNSIDTLYNIALRQDESGQKAETILFDLFSGKRPAQKGIDREIQAASKCLYNLSISQKKFDTPSKLLYIVGSSLNNQDDKNLLTQTFIAQENFKSDKTPLSEINLWANDRMQQDDEISSALDALNRDNNDPLVINSPLAIEQSGLLPDIIDQKKKEGQFLLKPELFPINTGNHWVLLGIYKEPQSSKVTGFLFNSYKELELDQLATLQKEIQCAGNNQDVDINLIEGNIQ